ncbi:MAG: YicC family protein [Clostridia bacterium]|nr:YicC family protein [Clostridia bacterium]
MLSMTGYGRGDFSSDGIDISVEIRTVNNRYFDINVKGPRLFVQYEDSIRTRIRDTFSRGHADVFITLCDRRAKQGALYLDESMADAYIKAAGRLHELHPELPYDVTVFSVLRYPDILKTEDTAGADDEILAALYKATDEALARLNEMRVREGRKLAEDMLSRVDVIEGFVNKICERAPLVTADYNKRLTEKVRQLLEDTEIDEARILNETAVFADKCNIDEELTRLKSHIEQFREICKGEKVGKQLDFLIQEFNRESNTICSKSNDIEVTRLGLLLKNEIEKIREQVQNVE